MAGLLLNFGIGRLANREYADFPKRNMSAVPEETLSESHTQDRLGWRSVALFFGLTFAIAWGIFVVLVMYPDWVTAHFGEVSGHNPVFILAVYAPAMSAISLVLFHSGPRGLGRYLARLGLWRGPAIWWGFLLVGIPAIYFAGAALKGNLADWRFPFPSVLPALGGLLLAGMIGPVEEIGWRGFAMPLLQRFLPPLGAALLLGTVWGLWHLPAFVLSGTPQSAWPFVPFFAGAISISVILTPMFNATRGSILWAALFHWQLNNPIWPDGQPYDMWLFVLTAVIVTVLNWPRMIRGENAVRSIYRTA